MLSTPSLFLSLRHASIRQVLTLVEVINKRLNSKLDSIRQASTWKTERIITTSQSPSIKAEKSTTVLSNFCAYNYLTLASNSEMNKAVKNEVLVDYLIKISIRQLELNNVLQNFINGNMQYAIYPVLMLMQENLKQYAQNKIKLLV
jgi:7-keto-8-aminopelargonate synthetase-like enzyme